MVSIGNQNWLTTGSRPVHHAPNGVNFGGGGSSGGGSTGFQARLEAIDRGEYSPTMNIGMSTSSPSGGTLMDRLDAIGTGELHPTTNRNFDIMA